MNYLEQAILDIIEEVYKAKYVGELRVTKWGNGYKLILGLNNPEIHPIVISADLSDTDFLKFIRKELISRLLISTKYFTGIKIYPEDEECNEERGTDRQNKHCNS